jgi:hypothetical protein
MLKPELTLSGCLGEYLREELVDDVFCEGCQRIETRTNEGEEESWRKEMEELGQSEYYRHCSSERETRLGLRGGSSVLTLFASAEEEVPPAVVASEGEFIKEQHWKRLSIKIAPEILCVHLKRRHFDQRGEIKLNDHVQFDKELTLPGHEQKKYALMSVVVHKGSFSGGHYYVYRRNKKKREEGAQSEQGEKEVVDDEDQTNWSEISDDYCRGVKWEEVATCQAYMFFYELQSQHDNKTEGRTEGSSSSKKQKAEEEPG